MKSFLSSLLVSLFSRFSSRVPRHFSLVTCYLSLVTAALAASPRLACDAPSFDAGPILPAPLTHEYVLRNDGDAPLEILNARASDGDFRLSAPSAPIPPGESGVLRADFTPIGRPSPLGTICRESQAMLGQRHWTLHCCIAASMVLRQHLRH